MVKELGYLEGIILYHYKLFGHSNSLALLQYDEDVVDMCALVPEFKEIEIYLEHLDYDVEGFLKCKESQSNSAIETLKKCKVLIEEIHDKHPMAIIPSGSKAGVDTGVESGCEIGVETKNVTGNEKTLDGISFTNTQGQVAHEFASEARTEATNRHEEATNGPKLSANGHEEDTNGPEQGGPDQGANGHPEGGPGP
ncbi:hypothetical protein L3X38_037953 [Prunus dulcis]|uniref:Uncharacterized protein n=1 Tax=Prunus dulcis TaxID=3755 RepID=A0AAD4V4B7_PRUDU|nr:hypothetical protein L3X38_037953 [Prunus dulcis]